MKACLKGLPLALSLVLLPFTAVAQNLATGTITGVVRDTSGAVLPGVTVEAASPALIEKVRTVVTDGQGVYRITELRPGTYTVTFTLTGFSTLRREGVELTTGFTATVNAQLAVGDLAGNDHGDRGGTGGRYAERDAADRDTALGDRECAARIGHHGLCHDAPGGEHRRGGDGRGRAARANICSPSRSMAATPTIFSNCATACTSAR